MSLPDVDELYVEQKLIAAEMPELLRISRGQTLTLKEQAKLSLLTAQLLAIPKKITGLLQPDWGARLMLRDYLLRLRPPGREILRFQMLCSG